MSEKKSLIRAAGVVGGITLLSRMMGLIRDAFIAARLGAGYYSDCFNIAFEIPNLARRVLGEGSLSAFIVPVYSRVRKEESEETGWRFVSNAINTFTIVTLIMTLLGILFSKQLFMLFGGLKFYAKGENQYLNLGLSLTRIMFPYLMFLTISSLLMGVLHTHRHFATPALGSVMLNLAIILAALFCTGMAPNRFTFVLAWAVFLGGILRVAIMIPSLFFHGFRYTPLLKVTSPRLKALYRMMIPAMLGLAVVHINISVDSNFANFLGPGRVTYIRNANHLIQFPLALFATAIGTAILPQLTGFLLDHKKKHLQEMVSFAFRINIVIFVPATMGYIAMGRPIVEMVLQRGLWTNDASQNTYFALLFYSLGLLPLAFLKIITPLYFAREDVMTPFKIGMIALVSNIILNALFILLTPLEHGGLALASSLSAGIHFFLLYRKEKEAFGPVFSHQVRQTFFRTLAASVLMGLCAWGPYRLLLYIHPSERWIFNALFTFCGIGTGIASFLLWGKLLQIEELDQVKRLLFKRKASNI
ncbi:murein biosynthesis integral membrane protein MurJ [Candidatus Sumerlaeota bacterium]|nr:murein biosynthesis integral membrane protein MurJ [Candidatus Sumerlaeota bacterium]